MQNHIVTKQNKLPSNLNVLLSEWDQIEGIPDWDQIATLGNNNIAQLISLIQGNNENSSALIKLQEEKAKATKKPYFIDLRPYNYYNVEDDIVVYTGGKTDCLIDEEWVTAKVIDGYHHHDGCVNYRTDVKIHTGEYLEGYGGGYGLSRPECLSRWEYDFLISIVSQANSNGLDFLSLWLNNIHSTFYKFNKSSYTNALVLGRLSEKQDKTE